MTPLEAHLIRRIRADGPLTIADYMTVCLLHPTHGYYTTGNPLGRDFTTAPEISQMFGELLGLCLAQTWITQGRPDPFNLVELGPGRGTLMADILRATARVPGFSDAAKVHLVEASRVLRQVQARTISAALNHHDALATVPAGPTFLIANEFFDALPIRQFVFDNGIWRERHVALDGDRLSFALSPPMHLDLLDRRGADVADGDMVEVCIPSTALASEIGLRIADSGGAALIVDYGDDAPLGDTFQAILAGEKSAPLTAPGKADLTAHVDFAALRDAASPARVSATLPQGRLLERLGITDRARTLAKGDAASSVIAAHRRLTHPDEMGSLFKAIAIVPPDADLPPGFE